MKYAVVLLLLVSIIGCDSHEARKLAAHENETKASAPVQIAFLADIHLHDFIAAAEGLDTTSLPLLPGTQTPVLMRSMQAQLNSTRLFNENYYVLRTALDDIAHKGIKLVALPGDFSDDGQPANVKALASILSEYTSKYAMRFFAITGNHDPVRPFTRAGGKTDFLTNAGKEVSVMSPDHKACIDDTAWQCSNEVREWGYAGILTTLRDFGFTPAASDLFYETPFGTTALDKRGWQWCNEDNQDSCVFMPDASYVVEPVEGVWLLAIDANVYAPNGPVSSLDFKGSGNAGYNALLQYKPELVKWIGQVVQRANAQNKRLIAFSHFPMADFYDDTQSQLTALFGENGMQMKRMPTKATTRVLSDLGLRLHMAGHMHLYDVAQPKQTDGLVNVQVPSLAAYQPGYSIVTLNKNHTAQVETVIQQQVDDFDTLFPLYKTEWAYRDKAGLDNWDKAILSTNQYLAFTDAHLKEVVRQRYVGREWPTSLANFVTNSTVGDALATLVCEKRNDIADQGFLALPAITLANDYYRIRNAGQFADLAGRAHVYEQLQDASLHCPAPLLQPEQQVRQFVKLLSDVVVKRDETVITVKGV